MRYQVRRNWPLLTGIGGGALILAALPVLGAAFPLALALAALAAIAGLGGQVLLQSHTGIIRERRLVATAADLRVATAQLERLATIDPLTGVRNRRAFAEALGTEFRRAQRYGRDLSVVMIDIDDFKRANDEGGHLFGDHVLRRTAEVIARNTRESDVVARYGGEEFVLMLPETDEAGAAAVAEKLLRAIEALEYRSPEYPAAGAPPYRVTLSAGLSCGPVLPEQDETELVRRADAALYAAKAAGKNRAHRWVATGSIEVPQTSS
ncbi:MAG: GGDEF domain-containing protein [Dehalococcoidia bacterium]